MKEEIVRYITELESARDSSIENALKFASFGFTPKSHDEIRCTAAANTYQEVINELTEIVENETQEPLLDTVNRLGKTIRAFKYDDQIHAIETLIKYFENLLDDSNTET